MLTTLFMALGLAAAPAAAPDVAGLAACPPGRLLACPPRAATEGVKVAAAAKRCHPDSTKAIGCFERQPVRAETYAERGAPDSVVHERHETAR